MESFRGQALSWELKDGVVELALHREPCNEIGSLTLEELEKFVGVLDSFKDRAHALIIYSEMKAGFCAGADCGSCIGVRRNWSGRSCQGRSRFPGAHSIGC